MLATASGKKDSELLGSYFWTARVKGSKERLPTYSVTIIFLLTSRPTRLQHCHHFNTVVQYKRLYRICVFRVLGQCLKVGATIWYSCRAWCSVVQSAMLVARRGIQSQRNVLPPAIRSRLFKGFGGLRIGVESVW